MIVIGADFEKVDIISSLYFKTQVGERFNHTVSQYFPSVLNGTDDMVQKAGLVVALPHMTVFHATNIHLSLLSPKQSFGAMFLVYRVSRERLELST